MTIDEILLRFFTANAFMTAAVLVVLAIRKPVRRFFGARLAYSLWLIALLPLLVALLPAPVQTLTLPAPEFVLTAPIETLTPAPDEAAVATPAPSSALSIDFLTIGFLAWAAGTLAMLGWLLRSQSRFLSDARAGFAGPAVVGVIRPRIITPSDFEERFDASEREVILTHETVHLVRNDARINALVALLRCICWFNPLVHVAAHVLRIDQEMACDATVVERHPRAKALYASALLKAQLAARPLPLGCYWPAGTEHPLMERIEMLKQTRPGRLRRIAGAAGLIGLAAGAGLAAWAALPPEVQVREQLATVPEPTWATAMTLPADYDPADPVHVAGVYEHGDFANGTFKLWVRDVDGKVWAFNRVRYSGPPQELTDRMAKNGVEVRGYRAKDKTCNPNCLAYAREIIIPDEGPVRTLAPARPAPEKATRGERNAFDARFDEADPLILRGKIEGIETTGDHLAAFGASVLVSGRAALIVRASEVKSSVDGAPRRVDKLWRVEGEAWSSVANTARRYPQGEIVVRGYAAKDKSCEPSCVMQGREIARGNRADIHLLQSPQPKPAATPLGLPGEKPVAVPVPEKPRPAPLERPVPALDSPQPAPVERPVPSREPAQPAPDDRTTPVPSSFDALPFIVKPKADADAPMRLRGVVDGVRWVNPSTLIGIREEGTGKRWTIETGTPNSLLRLGLTKSVVNDGAVVVAQGFGALDASCVDTCKLYAAPQWLTFDGVGPAQRTLEQLQGRRGAPAATAVRLEQPASPPAGLTPFAATFDGEDPIVLTGEIERFEAGGQTHMFIVRPTKLTPAKGGAARSLDKAWRVEVRLPDLPEATRQSLVGKTVTVRGYGAKDKSCAATCLMYGRDATLLDGTKVYPAGPPPGPVVAAPAAPASPPPPPELEGSGPMESVEAPEPQSVGRQPAPFDEAPANNNYDRTAGLKLTGLIERVDVTDGDTVVWVRAKKVLKDGFGVRPGTEADGAGRLWRVIGAGLGEIKAKDMPKLVAGSNIKVTGFNAADKSCTPTCRMNAKRVELD